MHNDAKREAKRVLSKMTTSEYEELYSRLDKKDGINNVYRLVKTRNFINIRCVEEEDQNILIN